MTRNPWQHKRRLASEKARKMGIASQRVQREKRLAEQPEIERYLQEIEIQNMPLKQGDAIGCIQWTDYRSGKVCKWVFRIGDRRGRITMHSMDGRATDSHGWTWVLNHLRGFLAGTKQ